MGHGYKHGTGGGSSGLNFKIVAGTTQPASPAENTIWVNTDEPITSYCFGSAEPDAPEEGMVWITTGAASSVAFNALKKNGIMLYPLSAKQYTGDAWISVDMQVYKDAEWQLLELVWYQNGIFNTEVLGEPAKANVNVQSDGTILLYRSSELKTTIAVDATPYSTFQYDIVVSNYGRLETKAINEAGVTLATTEQVQGVQTVTLDLSTINEPIYIHMYVYGNANGDNTCINNLKFMP